MDSPPGKISALIVQSLHENTQARIHVTSHPGAGTKISFIVAINTSAHNH